MQNSVEQGRGFLIILSSLLVILITVGGVFINQVNRENSKQITFQDPEPLLEVEREPESGEREIAEQENYENADQMEIGDILQ